MDKTGKPFFLFSFHTVPCFSSKLWLQYTAKAKSRPWQEWAFSRSEGTRVMCSVPFNKTGTSSFYYWVIIELSLIAGEYNVVFHCFVFSFSTLSLNFATTQVINLKRSKQNRLNLLHSTNHFITLFYACSVSADMFPTAHFLLYSLRVVLKIALYIDFFLIFDPGFLLAGAIALHSQLLRRLSQEDPKFKAHLDNLVKPGLTITK